MNETMLAAMVIVPGRVELCRCPVRIRGPYDADAHAGVQLLPWHRYAPESRHTPLWPAHAVYPRA